jgi:hypothetical protein
MKTLITKILAFSGLALLMLSSCKKDGQLTTISSSSTTASALSASSTTLALVKANLATTAVTFTATAPTYGFSAAVTNTLQFDTKGDNFATPKKEVVLSTLTQAYTVQDFNNILLAMSLPTGVTAQVEVRIKSSLSSSSTSGTVYSNVLTLTATPFALVSYVYVPGAYQGWNPATADSLQSATGNGIYTGIINFTAGNNQFLITPVKNWNNKYATNDGASTTGTSSNYTVVYNGNNNFYAPATAGLYRVTLNTNTNTLTIAPPTYYFSVIGDAAIDWSTDVDLKFNNGTLGWELTRAFASTGGFKVRMNHDWGTSWGFLSTPDGATLTSNNGGNMSVSATGTYKLVFTPTYDATTGKPNLTAGYTLVKQ